MKRSFLPGKRKSYSSRISHKFITKININNDELIKIGYFEIVNNLGSV